VVIEAAPAAPFKMSESDLLLEFLIVALDAPPQFASANQTAEGDVFGKRRWPRIKPAGCIVCVSEREGDRSLRQSLLS